VRRGARPAHLLVAACLVATAGCATTSIAEGRYRSPKGYRVAVPARGWTLVNEDGVDLILRYDASPAEMLVNASCDGVHRSRSSEILARHLLMGLRHRTVLEKGEVAIDGRAAMHVVLEGEDADERAPVRVDAYVLKGDRCVYDFLYAAPAAAFDAGRDDFRRLLESFTME
jgi:hypothetical protein